MHPQSYSGSGGPSQSVTNDRSHGVNSNNGNLTNNMLAPQTFTWGRQTRERYSVICIQKETKMNHGKKMIPQQWDDLFKGKRSHKRHFCSHPSLRSMKVTNLKQGLGKKGAGSCKNSLASKADALLTLNTPSHMSVGYYENILVARLWMHQEGRHPGWLPCFPLVAVMSQVWL